MQLYQKIIHELSKIFHWLSVNKLSLNISKTKYMLFRFSQRPPDSIPKLDLNINGTCISKTSTFNFLGIEIDDTLSWKSHITKVSNKISTTIGIMKKLHRFLPSKILLILYNSLISPHLHYGILAWGYFDTRIFKLQKRCVRIIDKSKYNAHTEPLFKKYSILKLCDLLQQKALIFTTNT